MSPEMQSETIDEIAAEIGIQPDIGGQPIEVQIPGGGVARFPANMATGDIEAVLQREFPASGAGGPSAYDASATDAGAPVQGMPQPFANAQPVAPRNAQPAVGRPDLMGATAATLSGIVQGIPVIGPMAQNVTDAMIGAGAQLTGGDYGQTVEGLRARRAQLAAANPVANVAGNLAGGFGTYGAAAKTGAAAALGLEGTLAARMGNSAVSGGLISAADTGARGGAPEEMLSSAVYGAGIGAVTPPLASAFGAAARAIGGKVAPAWAAATRPGDEASRRTGVALVRDMKSGADNLLNSADDATARAAGIQLMNVDRGGETTRALARSVANQSPEARSLITKAADERFNTQGLRAIDVVKRVAGGAVDDIGYQQAIQNTARMVNAPAYKAAYNAPQASAIWTPQIRNLMQAKPFQAAINAAEDTATNAAAVGGGRAVKNPFQFLPDGTVTLRTMPDGSRALPSLQFWDIVQRNLRTQADMANQSGNRLLAGQIREMRTQLVNSLDNAVPQFQAARQGAAAFFGADDALEAGKKFATQPRNLPEAQAAFAKFTDAEKTAFRTGYASELIDKIRATSDRANVVQQVFGNQSRREMMALVFGPVRARELEAYVRVETLADMIRGQLGGSTTARQLMELGIGAGMGSGIGFYSTGGNWQGALAGAVIGSGRKASQMLGQRIDADVMEHVARLLASRNPADIRKAITNASISPTWMEAIGAFERGLMIGPRATMPMAVAQ